MSTIHVYWRAPGFNVEEQRKTSERVVHTGVLTDEVEPARVEAPALVEELSARVYQPSDLPPGTVLYIEDHPGPLPPLAQRAIQAGFRIEHARRDPGLMDNPEQPLPRQEPEETGEKPASRIVPPIPPEGPTKI
ncbi:MAG: hypothetical protein J5J06_10845 [Phycisphaerae bacterium]|nr:hypothetical protein [Phycisphaerae bacterium]